MKSPSRFIQLVFLICALMICLAPPPAWALDEIFSLYTPPQAAAMGNALTADATGYLCNYYNPAGLAKATRRRVEVTALDLEGNLGFSGMGPVWSAKSFGVNNLFAPMHQSPGKYAFFSFSSVPSVAIRNFSFSFLTNYRYAALSDGTNIDMDAVLDFGPTVGFGTNFFGNILKLGVTAKAIVRNQLKGNFALSTFSNGTPISRYSNEGLGMGADIGMLITLPRKFLPTFGLVWKDVMNTNFTGFTVLNRSAPSVPEAIPQSVNAAVSAHPFLGKKLLSTIALEVKHLERNDLSLTKRISIGFQVEDEKSFYLWAGVNQLLLPTLGVALRLPGGNLELATYAENTAPGSNRDSDRRIMFRYTVGW